MRCPRLPQSIVCAALIGALGAGCDSSATDLRPADSGLGSDAASPAPPSSSPSSSSSSSSPSPSPPKGDASTSQDAGPDAASAPDLGPGGDFRSYADAVAAALQGFYDETTGLFPSTGWWNSANAITTLTDYMRVTGSVAYLPDLDSTFTKNSSANFLNNYYDDEGWWALAWTDVYDLTANAKYLAMAKTIFADMKDGWDSTCNGGIWWSKAKTYKNAIANELFLELAVRLHERTPGDQGAGSFIDWATREWSWFDASGMINGQYLVNDGLVTATCKNNGATTWTYNQGVVLGGLVDLAKVLGEGVLLTRAQDIAHATMTKLVDDQGVLHESCEPSCGGDGTQFKGIFMRHLAELTAASTWDEGTRFIATNADWIGSAARDPANHVGGSWSQWIDNADASRQSSALDALVAALPLSAPEANHALHASVTANGSCAAGQTAAQGVDGDPTTKWCAGSTNGYWIDVTLPQPTSIGRVVLRHAQSGGESAAWNTKDFLVRVDDGTTLNILASVTGNTRAVTIHRLAPSAPATHLRVEISAPQSNTLDPAARVYEVMAFER